MTDPTAPPPARRALVVDDAPTVRMYHGGILREAGFQVDEAVNGFEALEILLTCSYDLLVVDVNMPQMDGYALLQRLRAEPLALDCPVLTISTESVEANAGAAYQAGANFYLLKPVSPDVLRRTAQLLTSVLPTGSAPEPSTGSPS